ncbi:Exodeoxyribonuclease VII large subunit [Cohaesibacter gelatinilyticus]|uniref:Exodeoxyribonuclease 7 large subunit n=2 Tax=Cohaesibacter gelatinilyticus TaxID=372072 RepID=A0A285ND37_9HYPH|nr:Exodeoxyribonuclease VII large subunit [Cohaesibacter gelatinilyticus]
MKAFNRMSQSTNAAEFTVSEISYAVKSSIEEQFGYVRVRGELGRVSRPASGHIYLDLKDDKSVLNGVIWRGAAQKMTVRPEQGLEVIATGKLTTFPGQSKYQMVIDRMEPAGAGALMALLEERKKKLAAEGLFAQERKKQIPYLPRVIGVITSPSGAVIRDILHRVADRFPVHVIIWPVRVQGETCAKEVANGIRGFNALSEGGDIPRPDLLIVARGGGSLEDLWGFNEEEPVRAAAESDIPLISAVGHETDVTLIDYAADLRAPTPTGAAEMALPVKSELLATLGDLHLRQSGAVLRMMERRRSDLRSAARALPQPKDLLALARQRFDMASSRLGQSLLASTMNHRNRFDTNSVRLRPGLMLNKIAIQTERLTDRQDRLKRISLLTVEQKRTQLEAASRLLESLSHKGVLARGFALVRNRDHEMVRQAGQVSAGQGLSLEFSDGTVSVVAGLLDPVDLTPSDSNPATGNDDTNEPADDTANGIMGAGAISAEDIEATLRDMAGGKRRSAKPTKSVSSTKSDNSEAPAKDKPKAKPRKAPKSSDDAQGSLF